MVTLDHAKKRLRSLLDEVHRLTQIEFPYPSSRRALLQIQQLFQLKLDRLNLLDEQSHPSVVRLECMLSIQDLFNYLPLMGFLLRSTNVRNAFEVYAPLLRIAREVLEPTVANNDRKTLLVISSEWDYSPLAYAGIPDLPDFVLIGLPATESANPLLIPLSGHEIGHAIWLKNDKNQTLAPIVTKKLETVVVSRKDEYEKAFRVSIKKPDQLATDLDLVERWVPAANWALRQSEETFCDYVGLAIFGKSYLHAFSYLLAPSHGYPRDVEYPDIPTRAKNLEWAAGKLGITAPRDYSARFEGTSAPRAGAGDVFLLSVADEALTRVNSELLKEAVAIIYGASGLELATERETTRVLKMLNRVVPAEQVRSVQDIIDAGWAAAEDPALWSNIPLVYKERDRVLKDLLLKNIEVLDIEQTARELA